MEQRRQIRFVPHDSAFAALGSTFARVGKIKNISIGGLAFEYITDEDSDQEASQLDIFLSGNDFHLAKVPCRVVYDMPKRKSDDASRIVFETFMTKQCGVQFVGLTEDKVSQLDLFLNVYTTGVAPQAHDV